MANPNQALTSPNTDYSTEIRLGAFRDIEELTQEALLHSSGTRLVQCDDEVLSQSCDVLMLDDLGFGDPNENIALLSTRLVLRHDVVRTPEISGDTYRFFIDKTISTGYQSCQMWARSIMIYSPEDASLGSTAVHMYTVGDHDSNPVPEPEYPPEERFYDTEKFARQLKNDYLTWSQLTRVEVNDLIELLKKARDKTKEEAC